MQEIVKIIILHGGLILDVGEVSEGVARPRLSGLFQMRMTIINIRGSLSFANDFILSRIRSFYISLTVITKHYIVL